jgi:hypothetical protein
MTVRNNIDFSGGIQLIRFKKNYNGLYCGNKSNGESQDILYCIRYFFEVLLTFSKLTLKLGLIPA